MSSQGQVLQGLLSGTRRGRGVGRGTLGLGLHRYQLLQAALSGQPPWGISRLHLGREEKRKSLSDVKLKPALMESMRRMCPRGSLAELAVEASPVLAHGRPLLFSPGAACFHSGTFRKYPRPRRDPMITRQESADKLES